MMVSSLGRLVNVSVKVPEELRELMRRVKVDWSEYLREAIKAKIREELAREAAEKLDKIKSRAKEVPTEVLVRWLREEREKR